MIVLTTYEDILWHTVRSCTRLSSCPSDRELTQPVEGKVNTIVYSQTVQSMTLFRLPHASDSCILRCLGISWFIAVASLWGAMEGPGRDKGGSREGLWRDKGG